MSHQTLLPPDPPSLAPRRLSEDFRGILRQAAGQAVTLGELERTLQGRGFALFILLLSVPFCFPIAIPGLSMPFGVVIMLLGLRIALGRKPDLPGFILNKEIKYKTLERIVTFGVKTCVFMEKFARPRLKPISASKIGICLIGIGLASGGFQLLLPLPPLVPLSNTIPAVSVVLLTIGLIERDGVFVLAGYFVNIAAWIYFAMMGAALSKAFSYMMEFFHR